MRQVDNYKDRSGAAGGYIKLKKRLQKMELQHKKQMKQIDKLKQQLAEQQVEEQKLTHELAERPSYVRCQCPFCKRSICHDAVYGTIASPDNAV